MINKLKLVNHKRYNNLYERFCLYEVNYHCYFKNKNITGFKLYQC